MEQNDELSRVKESFQRCLTRPEFLDVFYKNFFSKGPHIVEKFKNTDMRRQMDVLRHGIQYMIMFAEGSRIAAAKIEDLGTTHDRNHRDIKPDWYADWLKSLVETVKMCDSQFSDDLSKDWELIMSHGIHRMKAMY